MSAAMETANLAAPFPRKVRAVVTGAGSGLGRAFCMQLAAQGARIIAADINLAAAKETAKMIMDAGGEGVAVKCDVAKLAQVEKLAVEAEKRWRGVDLLINNAGVGVGGHVGDVSIEDWHWITGINLWGVVHGCHVFVPRMKRRKRGWILNVASTAGIASLPEMAPYNVSKAGVISLSETLFSELAPYKIQVAVLCPTYFQTNLMTGFRAASSRQKHISQAFFNRAAAKAEEVAAAGLAGVQAGTLMVIPQADGRQVFAAKANDYNQYFEHLRAQVFGGVFDKLAKEGAASGATRGRKSILLPEERK